MIDFEAKYALMNAEPPYDPNDDLMDVTGAGTSIKPLTQQDYKEVNLIHINQEMQPVVLPAYDHHNKWIDRTETLIENYNKTQHNAERDRKTPRTTTNSNITMKGTQSLRRTRRWRTHRLQAKKVKMTGQTKLTHRTRLIRNNISSTENSIREKMRPTDPANPSTTEWTNDMDKQMRTYNERKLKTNKTKL